MRALDATHIPYITMISATVYAALNEVLGGADRTSMKLEASKWRRHVWTTPADQGSIFGSVRVSGAVMSSAFCAEDEFRWP